MEDAGGLSVSQVGLQHQEAQHFRARISVLADCSRHESSVGRYTAETSSPTLEGHPLSLPGCTFGRQNSACLWMLRGAGFRAIAIRCGEEQGLTWPRAAWKLIVYCSRQPAMTGPHCIL